MFVRLAPLSLRAKHWGWRDKPNGERNIVPKIIITDTINLFLYAAISILLISNHNTFRVLFDKIASRYFIWKKYFNISDEKLFNKILTCPNHILRTLLPPSTAQNYSLRNRPHNIQLPDRNCRITYSNFTLRMLYRNMYRLLYVLVGGVAQW